MSQNTFSMAGGVVRNPLVRLAKPVTASKNPRVGRS